jgi:hypothetical protein
MGDVVMEGIETLDQFVVVTFGCLLHPGPLQVTGRG